MTLEIELQIKQRIKEIRRLLKSMPDEAAIHYREVLNDEIIRLQSELAGISPLDSQSYLTDEESSNTTSEFDSPIQGDTDPVENFYSGKNE